MKMTIIVMVHKVILTDANILLLCLFYILLEFPDYLII